MPASRLRLSELTSWLDLLLESTKGQICAINLYQTYRRRLAGKDIIQIFIKACISQNPTTGNDALNGFKNICQSDSRFFALNQINPKSIHGTISLSTSMNSISFHQFILGRPRTIVRPVLPVKPRSPIRVDEDDYKNQLYRVTSKINWYNEHGSLGKPFPNPSHVWLADSDLVEQEIHTSPGGNTDGTKVRDALGLIDTMGNTYLLYIKFSASHLHKLIDFQIGRPVFSDNGNSRFAVYINTDAEPIYRDGWGQTVNLSKLRKRLSKINGVPERVCSPIMLSQIGAALSVIPIGWVNDVTDADDETFINLLLGAETIDDIKQGLKEVVT